MGMEQKLDKISLFKGRQEEDFVEVATRNEYERKMKVPGEVHAIGKMSFEVTKLRAEMKTKTVPQLQTVLERQERILGNKSLVAKLPDKGERAKSTRDMVIELLKDKEKVNGLEEEMNKLKINTEAMEWKNRLLDSDDDSDPEADGPVKNPLAVLAQGVVPAKSSKGKLEEDAHNTELELFAKKETEKVDNTHTKDSFVPFRSAKTTCLNVDLKSKLGVGGTKEKTPGSWDEAKNGILPHPNTPSIPLPPVYICQTKQLSLADSLKLQQDQDRRLKDIQLKHAAERLASSKGLVKLGLTDIVVKGQFEDYRNTQEESGGEEDVDSGDEGVGVVGIQQLTQNNDEN